MKLTLTLDKDVIERAKKVAKARKMSLSGLIESYLRKVINDDGPEEIGPITRSLSGKIKLPADFELKSLMEERLKEKYL